MYYSSALPCFVEIQGDLYVRTDFLGKSKKHVKCFLEHVYKGNLWKFIDDENEIETKCCNCDHYDNNCKECRTLFSEYFEEHRESELAYPYGDIPTKRLIISFYIVEGDFLYEMLQKS